MSEKMRKFLTVLLAGVFLVSTALMISSALDKEEANESYLQAQQIAGLDSVEREEKTDALTESVAPPVTEP